MLGESDCRDDRKAANRNPPYTIAWYILGTTQTEYCLRFCMFAQSELHMVHRRNTGNVPIDDSAIVRGRTAGQANGWCGLLDQTIFRVHDCILVKRDACVAEGSR